MVRYRHIGASRFGMTHSFGMQLAPAQKLALRLYVDSLVLLALVGFGVWLLLGRHRTLLVRNLALLPWAVALLFRRLEMRPVLARFRSLPRDGPR